MNGTKTHREAAQAAGRSPMRTWYWGLLALAALGGGCSLSPGSRAEAAKPAPSQTAAQPDVSKAAVAAAPASCPLAPDVAGYSGCKAVELTGTPPCEAICKRPRKVAPADRCCTDPVEVVVWSGTRALLRVEACSFVPPECANVHGHGRMDAAVRVLAGSPPELLVVEGGCEMRAMMHGYVPKGVAAWTGCVHRRYRWDGKELVKQ